MRKKRVIIAIIILGVISAIAILVFMKQPATEKRTRKSKRQEITWITESVVEGIQEDEGDYEKMLSELREKGVDDVLAEVNRQLEEWNSIK